MKLGKYSIGTGDRFGLQGEPQLAAVMRAAEKGVDLDIVWNKSHREHMIVNSTQQAVRDEAVHAVTKAGFSGNYFVDADHVGLENVELFLESSDFFTLDVADFIGERADNEQINTFISRYEYLVGDIVIPGMQIPLHVTSDRLQATAEKYLLAVKEAGKVYRHICRSKKEDTFITEVSMDETSEPQSPVELLFILAALADEQVPLQTIAPKFTGAFNKGVDYVGNVDLFQKEFEAVLFIITYCVNSFALPENLKISVHSGSDKFSIYEPIRHTISQHNAGIHIKTAGTTWLEELIGLAESGGLGLETAKQIYVASYERYDELCSPYASVIDINREMLPMPERVLKWSSDEYVKSLRHDQSCSAYDRNVRQLLHVGYKVAAEMGDDFHHVVTENKETVAKNVTDNLYERHIKPLFF